jgi:hypothetical protein
MKKTIKFFAEIFTSGTGSKILKPPMKNLQPDIHMLMVPWYHQHMYVRLQVFHWSFQLFGPSSRGKIFAENYFFLFSRLGEAGEKKKKK